MVFVQKVIDVTFLRIMSYQQDNSVFACVKTVVVRFVPRPMKKIHGQRCSAYQYPVTRSNVNQLLSIKWRYKEYKTVLSKIFFNSICLLNGNVAFTGPLMHTLHISFGEVLFQWSSTFLSSLFEHSEVQMTVITVNKEKRDCTECHVLNRRQEEAYTRKPGIFRSVLLFVYRTRLPVQTDSVCLSPAFEKSSITHIKYHIISVIMWI
jgi:hypothetical protein